MSPQAMIREDAPTVQVLDGIIFAPGVLDGPGPDDVVEYIEEVFCLACQAPVGRFESLGGELSHYIGDPMSDNILPVEADHAPYLP